ncbi:MAG: hypothetical protein MI861_12830, partial [Pirellulales bacterium]|nr:hypothetical protein [Pirellulales bacterium]
RAVEEEIDQLQVILAKSKSLAGVVPTEFTGNPEAMKLRSRFWRQLSRQNGETDLDRLFRCGVEPVEESDAPLSVHFTAVLNSKLTEFSGLRSANPGTLYDCLFVNQPSIDDYKAIKDWANQLRSRHDKTLPTDLASGVYFLVLAVAYVRCHKRITGMSHEAMRAGLVWLDQQPWLDGRVKGTVEKAIAALQ